jgi:hypothetical protein
MPDGCREAGAGFARSLHWPSEADISCVWGTKNPGSSRGPEVSSDLRGRRSSERGRRSSPGGRDSVGRRFRNSHEADCCSFSASKPLGRPPFYSRAPSVGANPHSGIFSEVSRHICAGFHDIISRKPSNVNRHPIRQIQFRSP